MNPVSLARSGHACSDACGIFFDPLCPCWYADGERCELPFDPVTFARLIATMRSPVYRRIFQAALWDLLRPMIERFAGQFLEEAETSRRRDALSLKAHLATVGIKIGRRDGKLVASPAEKVTAEIKRALAAYREILLQC
jgi:hypothetical protein